MDKTPTDTHPATMGLPGDPPEEFVSRSQRVSDLNVLVDAANASAAYHKRVAESYRSGVLRGKIDAALLADCRDDYDNLRERAEERMSDEDYLSMFCAECDDLPKVKDSDYCREHQHTDPDFGPDDVPRRLGGAA